MLYGFLHVLKSSCTEQILIDHISLMKKSGLYDATETIFSCVAGQGYPEIDKLLKVNNIQMIDRHKNPKVYEYLTLHNLKKFCDQNDCQIWYNHTKGAGFCLRGKGDKRYRWRRQMEFYSVWHWNKCQKLLKNNDVVGGLYSKNKNNNRICMRVNCWWANSDYIKKLDLLPKHVRKLQDRFSAETWVIGKSPRIGDVYDFYKEEEFEKWLESKPW